MQTLGFVDQKRSSALDKRVYTRGYLDAFDVSVLTLLVVMNILIDKSSFFGWTSLFHVPFEGDGVIDANPTTLLNGEEIMKVGFIK